MSNTLSVFNVIVALFLMTSLLFYIFPKIKIILPDKYICIYTKSALSESVYFFIIEIVIKLIITIK